MSEKVEDIKGRFEVALDGSTPCSSQGDTEAVDSDGEQTVIVGTCVGGGSTLPSSE